MKKIMIRALSLSLCLLMAVGTISGFSFAASAEKVTYRAAANGVSDSYKGSRYYNNLTQIELTGDGVTDLLAVAISQLGYIEGKNQEGFYGSQEGGGYGNYTEFCYNMGSVGGYAYAWCAAFVSWSLLQSRCTDQNTQGAWCRNHSGDKNYIWREVGCYRWYNQLKSVGYGYADDGRYTPKSGDLIFFESSEHIGIVRYSKNGRVYTIEGNTSSGEGVASEGGGVYCKNYAINSSAIRGYGSLPLKSNPNAPKVDYSGENPTTGLWISGTTKYLYPDTSLSDSSNYKTIPKGTAFEVIEIVSKTCFKVKYYDNIGYVSVNSSSPIYQMTSSAPSVEPEPPEPPVEKNTYYINKDIKKISGHFGSGIDKYYVGTKGSTKAKDVFEVAANKTIGITGFAGFDSFAKKYGYYFDGNEDAVVLDSSPLDPDSEAKKKGGDKTSEFKIDAPVSSLSDGEHTVTFVVQLLNKKVHPLVTLNINVTGSASLDTEDADDENEATEDISDDVIDESESNDTESILDDDGGCADDESNKEDNSDKNEDKENDKDSDKDDEVDEDDDEDDEDADGEGEADGEGGGVVTTSGCGASVALGAIVPMMAVAGALIFKKKKED